MRFARTSVLAFPFLLILLFTLSIERPLFAQQSAPGVQRDAQAVALLQSSVRAMGGAVPSDSVATGDISVFTGSLTSEGTIRILTRGTAQTSEQITFAQSSQAVTFSRLQAAETDNGGPTSLPLERSLTSQSPCFPLPFLSATLANPDEAIQYVGLETLGQEQVHHIRVWNTFASQPKFQRFAEFSTIDIWLDAANTLPQKISFTRRDGSGSVPSIAVDVYLSNYRSVAGIAFPFLIQKFLNGSPWMTITIANVAFNTGLTDASFPVQ